MTGGQMAPTTLVGKKSTTTPFGRNIWNEGYPLHISEVLASLEAPVYIERVGLGNNKQIMSAAKAIKKAIENQVRGLGFSLVEVLSPCPTIWKMQPVGRAELGARGTGEDLSARGLPRPHERGGTAPRARCRRPRWPRSQDPRHCRSGAGLQCRRPGSAARDPAPSTFASRLPASAAKAC